MHITSNNALISPVNVSNGREKIHRHHRSETKKSTALHCSTYMHSFPCIFENMANSLYEEIYRLETPDFTQIVALNINTHSLQRYFVVRAPLVASPGLLDLGENGLWVAGARCITSLGA